MLPPVALGKNHTDFLINNACSSSSKCMLQRINPSPEANCFASTPLWSEGSGRMLRQWFDLSYLYWFVRVAVIRIWRFCRKQWTTTHRTAMVHAFANVRCNTAFLCISRKSSPSTSSICRWHPLAFRSVPDLSVRAFGQLACRALIEENSKNVCSAPIWTGAMGLVSPERPRGSQRAVPGDYQKGFLGPEHVWNGAEISAKCLFDFFHPIFGVVILDQIFRRIESSNQQLHAPTTALRWADSANISDWHGIDLVPPNMHVSRNRNETNKSKRIGCFWMCFVRLEQKHVGKHWVCILNKSE